MEKKLTYVPCNIGKGNKVHAWYDSNLSMCGIGPVMLVDKPVTCKTCLGYVDKYKMVIGLQNDPHS